MEINTKISNINQRLKIVFLTPRFPYPLIGGDRLKPYYLLSHLAKKHEVTLVTFFQGREAPKSFIKAIENLGVELAVVPLDPINAGLRSAFKLLSRFPLEVLFYNQPQFAKALNDKIAVKNFDLGISFFYRTAEFIKNRQFKKILIAEDCRTLYQLRSYQNSNNLKQKMIRYWEYKKLEKYEPEIINHFDITTYVSHQDIGAVKKINPTANLALLTNGVDIEKFNIPADNSGRTGLLFAGKLDVWSNTQCTANIANFILPKVKKSFPDIKFNIVGAKPPDSVQKLANSSNSITLESDVPEMQPYLRNSKVFIHPHFGGSGIQNKLIEAMACGCPVVTTPSGIQGIDAVNGESVLIGNNFDELAELTIKILKDEDFASNIAINARKHIEKKHSWDVIYKSFDDIINSVIFA
ncbi:MAG: hypothetical protein QG635_1302 [Bacteroidota bacterium]|nr:hypothetical protein [Bacteroidota bacterium]